MTPSAGAPDAPSEPEATRRRTQQERRAETQGLLMQATISCLLDLGYARTTTQEVLRRAGVSKGALTHHYAAKADLVLAAMEALYIDIGGRLRAEAARLPSGPERDRPAVLLIWGAFDGPLFFAAMELWTAARTDEDLRAALLPQERQLGREMRALMAEMLGSPTVDNPGFAAVYRLVLTSMRGHAMTRSLGQGSDHDGPLIDRWVGMVAALR